MQHLIKRRGHREEYEPRKIYASVYSACMSLRMTEGEAELIAEHVTQEVDRSIKAKLDITSDMIFELVVSTLTKYNPDASYMYKTHRDLS